jgi:hypothetical protein
MQKFIFFLLAHTMIENEIINIVYIFFISKGGHLFNLIVQISFDSIHFQRWSVFVNAKA